MANWIFPVVGATEWSGGSWMPYQQNHRGRTHAAVDIYASKGSPIIASVSGTVKNFGTGNIGGNWIQVQGSDGNVYYYAHMNSATKLKKGAKVVPGTTLGSVGNTGSAKTTKPHVHFSVKRNGKAISPVDMLRGGLVMPNVGKAQGDDDMTRPGSTNEDGTTDPYAELRKQGLPDSEPGDYDSAPPPWIAQLEEYRMTLGQQQQQPQPVKERARARLHKTLMGMSDMVRSQGFDTGAGMPDTGIEGVDDDTGLADVGREGVARA